MNSQRLTKKGTKKSLTTEYLFTVKFDGRPFHYIDLVCSGQWSTEWSTVSVWRYCLFFNFISPKYSFVVS